MLFVLACCISMLGQAQNLNDKLLANNQETAHQYYQNAQRILISKNKRSDKIKDAILSIHKAAELGHPAAQFRINRMYL